jgi:hypothetical protein
VRAIRGIVGGLAAVVAGLFVIALMVLFGGLRMWAAASFSEQLAPIGAIAGLMVPSLFMLGTYFAS